MQKHWRCLFLLSMLRFPLLRLSAVVLSPQALALEMQHGLSGVRGGAFGFLGHDSVCAQQSRAVCNGEGCAPKMMWKLVRVLLVSTTAWRTSL